MLPDSGGYEESAADVITELLSLSSASKPPLNTLAEEANTEELELTENVKSLNIDDRSNRICYGEDSSDEDIFLTDDEEQVISDNPSTLPHCVPVTSSSSEVNQNNKVDKSLECDLDSDQSFTEEPRLDIESILKELLEVVFSNKIKANSSDDEEISGEESFEDCEEEYDGDDDTDMFEEESDSDDAEESSSDPSWRADHSDVDEDEAEPRVKNPKVGFQTPRLMREEVTSMTTSDMDSGSLSFYMSDTGPIQVQVSITTTP